jgi:hypothetical protein
LVRIFITHSSADEWLISTIVSNLKLIPVDPYLAKLEDPTPYPLPQKLDSAIDSSTAMFAFLTPNVADNKHTRDVVNWEISAAYAKKKPIYVFVQKGVEVPLMVNYITVYATYDPFDQKTLNEMSTKVQEIASRFKQAEDSANSAKVAGAVVLGLLGLGLLVALSDN